MSVTPRGQSAGASSWDSWPDLPVRFAKNRSGSRPSGRSAVREEDEMGLRDVSAVLWKERHLLELPLFKLEEEQLLLAAGRNRWLPRATREVEMVLEELRHTELERAVEVERVSAELGL